jgi:hypothetical protein
MVFEFNWKVAANMKYPKNVIFYVKLKQYIYNKRFKFINCLVPIVF